MKHSIFVILGFVLTISILISVTSYSMDNISRQNTVVFDASWIIANPLNFNCLVPGVRRSQGMHQAVWEPLFILNYETGEIESWLGKSFVPNPNLDIWTLTIRRGVLWADGETFNADDVVMTINLLLNDESQSLNDAANMQQWVDSVQRIDDLTVQFNLRGPNPRFQLDYFSVRVGGSIVILPEHVWKDKDPFTFDFYDPENGWPLGTGPYQLVKASENEFVYDRCETWWGTEVGFEDMPVPKRLIWAVTGSEENRSMLAIDSQLDSLSDITLGAFEAILAMNPNIISWQSQMPYIWLDPCPRQLSVNHQVEPWSQPDMRRALSMLIDRQQVVEIAYEGTSVSSKTIFVQYKTMEPYIDAIQHLWIDPESNVSAGQALIESQGWKLNIDGFYEKDGRELSLDIQTWEPAIEKRRIAEVVVEQFRAAGINATTRAIAGSTWDENKAFGNFEAVLDWDACGSVNEPWFSMNRYTKQFYRPIGSRTPGNNNFVRWTGSQADKYSKIVDKIGILPLNDLAIEPLVIEAMEIFMNQQVVIPITQARKLVPFNTTYWVGWPTEENNFNHPATWWMSAHQIIHRLRKSHH